MASGYGDQMVLGIPSLKLTKVLYQMLLKEPQFLLELVVIFTIFLVYGLNAKLKMVDLQNLLKILGKSLEEKIVILVNLKKKFSPHMITDYDLAPIRYKGIYGKRRKSNELSRVQIK